ncbi:MAG: hypothetical protein ABSH05_00685 [Bryobacteraceae bacterium]|jgi:hypothetical protein
MRNTCIKSALAAMVFVTLAAAQRPMGPSGPPAGGRQGDVAHWIGAEMAPPGGVVRGAPYSAQAVTEVNQTLGDGNKIHRVITGAVYRDGQGRTRNESVPGGMGPLAPTGDLKQLVTISDPVAGFTYVLDPAQKTATKVPLRAGGPGGRMAPAPGFGGRMAPARGFGGRMAPAAGPGRGMMHAGPPNDEDLKIESLGPKQIEGVQAEGRRVTTTILAGKIGNERPIVAVTERWFSPQLRVVVLMTHNDPRMGQDSYKLTKIALGEPDHSLFEVPAGYTVIEGRPATFRGERPAAGPEPRRRPLDRTP